MRKTCLISVLAIAMVFGFALGVSASTFLSKKVDNSAGLAVKNFWTKARMKAAEPHPIPILEGDPLPFYENAGQVPSGSPAHTLGADEKSVRKQSAKKPGVVSELLSENQKANRAYAASVAPFANGYDFDHPPENTSWVWHALYGHNRGDVAPYRVVGRLFFKNFRGWLGACSGVVVGDNVVLTAGHCVSKYGRFHTDIIFVPSYRSGVAPHGKWPAKSVIVPWEWHLHREYGRDVAAVLLYPQSGKKVSDYTGRAGVAWNQGPYQHFTVLAYPADPPFTGDALIQTDASTARISCSDVSPCTTGIGTRQTAGSSGGPWFINFQPGPYVGDNRVNGVVSHKRESLGPNIQFTSYFDSRIGDLWRLAIQRSK